MQDYVGELLNGDRSDGPGGGPMAHPPDALGWVIGIMFLLLTWQVYKRITLPIWRACFSPPKKGKKKKKKD